MNSQSTNQKTKKNIFNAPQFFEPLNQNKNQTAQQQHQQFAQPITQLRPQQNTYERQTNQIQSLVKVQNPKELDYTVDETSVYEDVSLLKDKVVSYLHNYSQQAQQKQQIKKVQINQDVKQVYQEYQSILDKYSIISQSQIEITSDNIQQQSIMNQSYLKTGGPKEQNINKMIELVEEFLNKFQIDQSPKKYQQQQYKQQEKSNFNKKQQFSPQKLNEAIDQYLCYLSDSTPNQQIEESALNQSMINETMDIYCINCEQFIPFNQINYHSKNCNENIKQNVNSNDLIKKLQKICKFILNKASKLSSLPQKSIIQNLIVQLLIVKNINEIYKLPQFCQKLQKLIEIFNSNSQGRKSLSNRELQIQAGLNRLLIFLNTEQNSQDNLIQFTRNSNSPEGQEKKKSMFFNLVLEAKMKMKQDNPYKYYLISDLFEECQKQGIQENQWKQFIAEKFGIDQFF